MTAAMVRSRGDGASRIFVKMSTVATAALVAAGTGASTLWFLRVLRTLGLRIRFAPA
jgi:hypothetical protein